MEIADGEMSMSMLEKLHDRSVPGYRVFMTPSDEEENTRTYTVVINDEEQYSIWLADREIPKGWRSDGTTGPKAECLKHIDEVWTDMRPLSLRKWMAEQEAKEAQDA